MVKGYHSISVLINCLDPEQKMEGTQDFILQSGQKALEQWKMPWLLILDNVDDFESFTNPSTECASLRSYLPSCGRILITSRDYRFESLTFRATDYIKVNCMSSEEAGHLLRMHLPQQIQSNTPPAAKLAVTELLNKLGSMPLAVAQAGFNIMDAGYSIQEFKQLLDEQERLQSLMRKGVFSGDCGKDIDVQLSIMSNFQITFQRIKKKSPIAEKLMFYIAVVTKCGTPEDILRCLPEFVGLDLVVFRNALKPLTHAALVEQNKIYGKYDRSEYVMHPVIQDLLSNVMPFEQKQAFLADLSTVMGSKLPYAFDSAVTRFKDMQIWRLFSGYVSRLVDCNRLAGTAGCIRAWLELLLIRYLSVSGRTVAAAVESSKLYHWATQHDLENTNLMSDVVTIYAYASSALSNHERINLLQPQYDRLRAQLVSRSADDSRFIGTYADTAIVLATLFFKEGQSTRARDICHQAIFQTRKLAGTSVLDPHFMLQILLAAYMSAENPTDFVEFKSMTARILRQIRGSRDLMMSGFTMRNMTLLRDKYIRYDVFHKTEHAGWKASGGNVGQRACIKASIKSFLRREVCCDSLRNSWTWAVTSQFILSQCFEQSCLYLLQPFLQATSPWIREDEWSGKGRDTAIYNQLSFAAGMYNRHNSYDHAAKYAKRAIALLESSAEVEHDMVAGACWELLVACWQLRKFDEVEYFSTKYRPELTAIIRRSLQVPNEVPLLSNDEIIESLHTFVQEQEMRNQLYHMAREGCNEGSYSRGDVVGVVSDEVASEIEEVENWYGRIDQDVNPSISISPYVTDSEGNTPLAFKADEPLDSEEAGAESSKMSAVTMEAETRAGITLDEASQRLLFLMRDRQPRDSGPGRCADALSDAHGERPENPNLDEVD